MLNICLLPGCDDSAVPADPADPATSEDAEAPETAETTMEFTLPWVPGEGLDPYSGDSRINSVSLSLLYEPLFSLSPAFEASPCLCASFSSVDALEYTITLRSDAAFSSGEPLTSADVLYYLHEAMRTDSRFAARLSDVQRVSAPDEHTVVVPLLSPNANLPALLDIPIVKDGSLETGSPIGTGPYILIPEQDSFSLRARYDWWQSGTFPLDSIHLYDIKSMGALFSAFQTRNLSLLTADLSGANTPGYRGDYEVRDCSSSTMLYLGCNSAEDGSLLSDPALRRALMQGVDRVMIASSLYAEHAEAAALPLSPASADYDDSLADSLSYSREALRTLLDAAGWTDADGDGFLEKKEGRKTVPLQLRLLVPADSSYKTAAGKVISETLSYAGIEVIVETCFWDRYIEVLEAGEFDLFLGEVRLTADFALRSLLLTDGALNYGKFSDPDLEAFLIQARQTGNADDLALFYSRFAEQAPLIPILFKNESVLTQRDLVTGIVPTTQNAFYNLQNWTLHT
jgi:peptide/nickel transport system substrate-binding protein